MKTISSTYNLTLNQNDKSYYIKENYTWHKTVIFKIFLPVTFLNFLKMI